MSNSNAKGIAAVSLGKPSLRRRLESYYSLVAPKQIENETAWLRKFQQIYSKYGGSHDGERSLAKKLEAKYGRTVRLLLAKQIKSTHSESSAGIQREESWYQLTDKEVNSGVVDFTSDRFDPLAALSLGDDVAKKVNPILEDCPQMDYIDLCRSLLPPSDPLRRNIKRKAASLATTVTSSNESKKKRLSLFAPVMETLKEQGPFAVLHRALSDRKRIRVVIRYANEIRGTLTGHLIAFDKHMNLWMRDVLEIYTVPRSRRIDDATQSQQEVARRKMPVQQRQMHTMLIRGDNIVMTYFAESERSVFPRTSKSPKESIYRKNLCDFGQQLGTLGSLMLAQKRK
mmetsp:Transcript_372/g.525  ORF Transcript_372/g.525 Transcript_372/m.525 type:complete len:342 (-) Transcript_372:1534-2559(-)